MSNLSSIERKKFYHQLVTRDGEKCKKCGKTLQDVRILEIHETIYERPLKLSNMELLCHGCNHLKEVSKKNILRTQSISAEHKKALAAYPLFIKWLYGEITKPENNFHLSYDQIIAQGAYEIGTRLDGTPLSTETIKRYMEPLIDHPTSPYITMADNFGQMNVWLRGKEPEIEN